MLGGGTFTTQNKVLPGTYINFVSAASAPAQLGARGYLAMALPLHWGPDDRIFTVTAEDFRKNCRQIFGFKYDSDEAKGLRDVFKNATVLYCYKLMKGGAKAANNVAEALYKGSCGAKIATEILEGTTEGTYDVNIYYDGTAVYAKTVRKLDELTADDNGYVRWTMTSLAAAEKTLLTGNNLAGETPESAGSSQAGETVQATGNSLDGEPADVKEHSQFLDASQAYTFNAMACLSDDEAVKALYVQEVKDMRENAGVKYKVVLHGQAADYEGVINVKNCVDAVYWAAGAEAGCAVNASNTNKTYDGEFDIPVSYNKDQLESAIQSGEYVFHKVGSEIRVLEDINSLVTVTGERGKDFKSNQSVRVMDQIAMDVASLFNNKYMGKIPNDAAGRISLWNDIVEHHKKLDKIRAIEGFTPSDVSVEIGDSKKSVVVEDAVTIVNAMEKLYMNVVVA